MPQPTIIANRYQVIDKLGQGSMGAVYKVYDRLEQREVALKQNDPHANQWFTKGLKIDHENSATPKIIGSVMGFGGVHLQKGQLTRAATLIGLAQSHRHYKQELGQLRKTIQPNLITTHILVPLRYAS